MAGQSVATVTVNIGFTVSSATAGVGPYLTFNDPTWGQIGVGEFAGTYTWNDVSPDLRSIRTVSGRQRQIDTFPAGTCEIILDNNAGNYDPDNPASPFAGDVLPMRPVQIIGSWNGVNYPIWYGYIDWILPTYTPGKYSDASVTIRCSDAMKIFQNLKSSGSYSQELSGTRINNILNAVGWSSSLRSIDGGDLFMQANAPASTVLQDIQSIVDAEGGRWYIGAEGNVYFESRSHRNKKPFAQASWTDSGAGGFPLLYTDAARNMDDDLIKNVVTITNQGGNPKTFSDAASIAQYQTRSFSATGYLLVADADAYALAAVIAYIDKQLYGSRFDQLIFQPLGDPTNLFPEVLFRKISDRVNVLISPPNVTPFFLPQYVEGVRHTITFQPQLDWQVQYQTSTANYPPFLIFNDGTFGLIGTDCFGF